MNNQISYDTVIVGGGLAGLGLSIQLAKAGYHTAVFEKENYPVHRVCGEYISFESWNFLEELGLPLSDWNLPMIKRLLVTAPGGKSIESELPLGGFGISRYKLDATLAQLATESGVELFQNTRVNEVQYQNGQFSVTHAKGNCGAKLVCGAFGKRSNLDIKWKRHFTLQKNNRLNNYIGVKYHVHGDFLPDQIALHNFRNGYCGISQVEDKKFCLCYLTTAENLRRCGNSIPKMEKEILMKNWYLENIFSAANFEEGFPVTISQVSFAKKSKVENHQLFVGDAAGMITPLCGNGMSMALHGSKIAFQCIDDWFKNGTGRYEMEQEYTDKWNHKFGNRLLAGRLIQGFFGNESLSNLLIGTLKPFPRFVTMLIKQTHGDPF